MPDPRRPVFAAIHDRLARLPTTRPRRVAVTGIDAAGKTTFADALADFLRAAGDAPVLRACVDGYLAPAAHRYRQGRDSPRGYYEDSVDDALLVEALLAPLGPGGDRVVRVAGPFDFDAEVPRLGPPQQVAPSTIAVVDGIFLLRAPLRAHWELSIFLAVDFDVALDRALARDVGRLGPDRDAVRQRYETRYWPGQRLCLAHDRPAERADLVVDNDDPTRPRLVRG